MAKKEQIAINRSERLSEIDVELDAAMERLDETNVRIDDVLTSFDPPEASEESEGAETFDDGADSHGGNDVEDDADEDEAPDEDDEDADSSE
ncbi:MAG: hypothetical protein QGG73_00495 [Candidatus Hydrogenedentes bacterium]|jgi:hypothetical protein|nr:hypothetical protein [Candidatus Hydrogenedentota bacterium]